MHRVERELYPRLHLQRRRRTVPAVQQPGEGAEQEVPRPTGRVDHPEAVERPLAQRRLQRPVQDELLDELRRLQQRVGVLGVLRQVLVEVAQEAGRQRWVGEVAYQPAVVAAGPPEGQQRGDRVARRRHQVQRRMRVDERGRRGQCPQVRNGRQQPLAGGDVTGPAALAVEGQLGVQGLLPPRLRAADPDRLYERVVLGKPQEHSRQHPADRRLGDPVVAPRLPR